MINALHSLAYICNKSLIVFIADDIFESNFIFPNIFFINHWLYELYNKTKAFNTATISIILIKKLTTILSKNYFRPVTNDSIL